MEEIKETKKVNRFAFAALNPYLEDNMIDSKEKEVSGKGFITWGSDNSFPDYLYNCYESVSTLHSIIEGTVDFICGEGLEGDEENKYYDLIRSLAQDLLIYNGFAINVIRNKNGNVVRLIYVDLLNLRSNQDNTVFYYSKDWTKSFGRVKTIELPAYDKNAVDVISSIYYYKGNSKKVYPTPLYIASLKSLEISKKIADFHLNGINNGFTASYLIGFNNGVPSDPEKEEIEEYFNEKFGGAENAGRMVMSFAENKEHSVELNKIEVEDYGTKYESLRNFVRQDIFTSFRANPNLFGIPTENNGFSNEEYEESFRLYNRTMVKPRQIMLCNAINNILGTNISIIPFTMDETKNEIIVEE